MTKIEEKYRRIFSIRLNSLYREKNWEKARDLLENEIKQFPAEYFLHTELALVYLNLTLFEQAYNSALIAVSIEPNDPLVIYNYARTLYSIDKYNEALDEWSKIVNQGLNGILKSEHNESVKWAKSIVNDSRFGMALCYNNIGNIENSRNLINDHLKYRQRGLYSDFTKKQIIKKLNEIS